MNHASALTALSNKLLCPECEASLSLKICVCFRYIKKKIHMQGKKTQVRNELVVTVHQVEVQVEVRQQGGQENRDK